jgi:hypothetical protein
MVTTTFTATDFASLNTAIKAIDAQGAQAAPNTAYTINITGTINVIGGGLEAINLLSGSSVTILGSNGAGGASVQTLNGLGAERGFFVESGAVTLQNLTLQNMVAGQFGNGGSGAEGGGGGAGLGGGLFVASGGNVALIGVAFSGDSATGGAGGSSTGNAANGRGGGGGMAGGTGGSGGNNSAAGGGGLGFNAHGGNAGTNPEGSGSAGIVQGAAAGGPGGVNGAPPGAGGVSGGGGGAASLGGGGGGGIGGASGAPGFGGGGNGGFGGGGGGGGDSVVAAGGDGGFGGGGGGSIFGGGLSDTGGGGGGFGGGGGADGGNGGFGAGNGSSLNGAEAGNGGGGLGAGGDIFVQQGGTLLIEGGGLQATNLGGGIVKGGNGGSGGGAPAGGSGMGLGGALFIQGNTAITFAPQPGQTVTVSSSIADQKGSVASDPNQGGIIDNGAGIVVLGAANTYTGGTTIIGAGAILELAATGATGGGPLTFAPNVSGTVQIDAADTAPNTIVGQGANDVVKFAGQTRGGFTIAENGAQFTVTNISNPAEIETLTGINSLQFSDRIVLLVTAGDSLTFVPSSGQTLPVNSEIDGNGAVVVDGAGTVVLGSANTYTGGTTIAANGATLELAANGAGGAGPITFAANIGATVQIDAADTGPNTIVGQGGNDTVFFNNQPRSAFTIAYVGSQVIVTSVANPTEVETLSGVTNLQFANGTVNIAPVPSTAIAAFDPSFTLAGVGDFNGDGMSDLVWDQPSSGTVEIQFLDGTAMLGGGGAIPNNPFGPNFTVVATGDFNGDGFTDLAYRNPQTGLVELQFLNGKTPIGGGAIANSLFDASFNVVAAADFNGDGKTDLVYQRASDGLVEIQFLNGNTAIGGGAIPNSPFTGTGFTVVGAGNFGNGHQDLVYQRASDGVVAIQLLNGVTQTGGGVVPGPFDASWKVVGVGNFGNGQSDLVYQQAGTGIVEVQLLNGITPAGGGVLANAFNAFGPGWQVVGVGDFNGDGNADLVYRNMASGITEVQLLHGLTPFASSIISFG